MGILQEQLLASEARAARSEEQLAGAAELRARADSLEEQLAAWQAACAALDIRSAAELSPAVAQMRAAALATASKLGDAEAHFRAVEGHEFISISI